MPSTAMAQMPMAKQSFRRRRLYYSSFFPNRTLLFLLLLFLSSSMTAHGRLLDTSVACDQHNFILSLNFDVPFRGLVYSEEGFPNCIYVNGTMLSHLNYQLKIPLHGCETRINGDGNFENGIIIQENVAFLQGTDKKYLLTCIPSGTSPTTTTASSFPPSTSSTNGIGSFPVGPPLPTSGPAPAAAFGRENSVTVDFGGVTVDQSLASTESVRGTLPPSLPAGSSPEGDGPPAVPELKYTVEIRAGHSLESTPIKTALNIGDPISYVVRLRKPVSESQIGRCWASDSKSSLELSDEHGCSLQPRGNIWGPFERVDAPNELVFVNRIKAWAFPTSNEVNIFCNLRVCMSRHCSFAANCSEVPSPSSSEHQNERRHRREDGGGGGGGGFEEIETIRASIRLRPKRQNGGSGGGGGHNGGRRTELSSLIYANDDGLFDNDDGTAWWCLSFGQLLLVGACCCVASICLTLAATFLIHAHFCQAPHSPHEELGDNIWSMLEQLKRRNMQENELVAAAQQRRINPPDGAFLSSRHAV